MEATQSSRLPPKPLGTYNVTAAAAAAAAAAATAVADDEPNAKRQKLVEIVELDTSADESDVSDTVSCEFFSLSLLSVSVYLCLFLSEPALWHQTLDVLVCLLLVFVFLSRSSLVGCSFVLAIFLLLSFPILYL